MSPCGTQNYTLMNVRPDLFTNTMCIGENYESSRALVFKTFVHCEGCAEKFSRCLKDFEGIEHITIDRENHKVVIRGDIAKDPYKVLDRLRKKYSKNVELIVPKLNLDYKRRRELIREEQARVNTVVLKMYLHCDNCAIDVKTKIERMEGVISVELNKVTSHVIVKGIMEPSMLVESIKRKLGKHAEIIREGKGYEDDNDQIVMFSYPPQYSSHLYPDQTFSDENVNACSIM